MKGEGLFSWSAEPVPKGELKAAANVSSGSEAAIGAGGVVKGLPKALSQDGACGAGAGAREGTKPFGRAEGAASSGPGIGAVIGFAGLGAGSVGLAGGPHRVGPANPAEVSAPETGWAD